MSKGSEQAETAELVEVQAPCSLVPECTRERLLSPPDWRYQAASAYIMDEAGGVSPTIPEDPTVQLAVRALRACNSRKPACVHNRTFLFSLWPEVEEALYYGVTNHRSAVTAEIEMCIIRGMDSKQAAKAGCLVRPAVYELYGKLFFDLSGLRAMHSWMQDFLFEPERYAGNATLLRSRLLAYMADPEALAGINVTGMTNRKADEFMKRVVSSERFKQVFDYIVRKTKLPGDLYAQLMEAAVNGMTNRDFQEHMKDRDEAGSESLEELAEHMEEGIRAYSQKELAAAPSSGVDFVNQYTKVLTGHDNGETTGFGN